MRELKRLMKPNESAISIANCAISYFEDPSRIQCVSFSPKRPALWADVVDLLRQHTPNYLVVPGSAADRYLTDLLPEVGLELVYEDPVFRIYRQGKPAG